MIKRWMIYLRESISPIQLIFVFSLSFAIHTTLDMIHSKPLFSFWYESVFAGFNIFLLFLFSRISDEFKDFEVDKIYFPNRPLPSGRVFVKDLLILKWISIVLIFLINIMHPIALYEFLVAFLFFFLMSKWFFIPKILSNNRILIFLTHGPIYIFMMIYIIALYTNPLNIILLSKEHMLIAIWFLFPGLIWEIARKIRSPKEDSDGYQSYSQLLGFRVSTFILILFIIVHFLLFLYVSESWKMSQITLILFGIISFLFICMCIYLILKIPDRNNKMKPMGNIYYILSYILIVVNTLFL